MFLILCWFRHIKTSQTVVFTRFFNVGAGEGFGYICAEGAARKRLVMSQRRYEGACNRIADANVTFCDKGGMTKHMTDFSAKKNRNGAKSIPTW